LKFVIANDTSRAYLVTIGEAKTQRDPGPRQRGNEAIHEGSFRGEIEYPAITPDSIHLTPRPLEVLNITLVACWSASTHDYSPFLAPKGWRHRFNFNKIEYPNLILRTIEELG
jgi:hypothetical protein